MLTEAYKTIYFYSEKSNKLEGACLSVFLSSNAFIYAISTRNFKQVVEVCHLEFNQAGNSPNSLKENCLFLIQNYLLHQKKFEKVNIAILNNEFTLVPEAYAVNTDTKTLLKFTTGISQIKNILTQHVNGIQFCYTAQQDLVAELEKTFTNASIRHAGAVTISLLFSQHSLLNSNLFLNINDGFIELAAKEGNNLLFYNVFNYENNEDVLYYLLFAMEQFNLNPLLVKLCIAAQKEIGDDLIKNIKKYIKQVSFCVNDPSIKLSGELLQLPQHYYFTVLNQHLCEL